MFLNRGNKKIMISKHHKKVIKPGFEPVTFTTTSLHSVRIPLEHAQIVLQM